MGQGGAAPMAFMPRNTSVEDFLSLVESGDIPPVEVCICYEYAKGGVSLPAGVYQERYMNMHKGGVYVLL